MSVRDGFEFCEQDVRETDEDADRRGTIPHDVVMASARTTIERHAVKRYAA